VANAREPSYIGGMSTRRRSRLAIVVAALACLAPAALSAPAASAHTLSKKRALGKAYALARSVGTREGAVYAIAGYCKRRSPHRVDCWAGIIFADSTGAAQRVKVTLEGRRVRAARYGRIYSGDVGERRSGQSGQQWAICGIRSSVCIGS
jgi:hypothetical protein